MYIGWYIYINLVNAIKKSEYRQTESKRFPKKTACLYEAGLSACSRVLPNTLVTHVFPWSCCSGRMVVRDHRNQRNGSGTGRPKLEACENRICLYERLIPPALGCFPSSYKPTRSLESILGIDGQ